jgi:hypothetical protein
MLHCIDDNSLNCVFIMRWVRYKLHIGRGEACTEFWLVNPRERDHWGDPGVDGRIILCWIFRKWDVEL